MASVRNGRLYVESSNHGTARPILAICEDHGTFTYAINSDRVKALSTNDVAQIFFMLTRIFIEKTFGN